MQNKAFHYVDNYLAVTTSWIYSQIVFNKDFKQYIFAQKKHQAEFFPVENLYSYQDLSGCRKVYNRLIYLFFKYYPYCLSVGKAVQPDVIHAHFGNIGYKVLRLKEIMGIPLIVTFYGCDLALANRKKYQRRYAVLFEKADLFLLEGSHMAKELEKLGCPAEKIKVFHLGVDVDKIQYKEKAIVPGAPIQLLFTATLTEKKGCEYLIRAYSNIINQHRYTNVHLKIIGQGKLKDDLLNLSKELQVYDQIDFVGYIPYSCFLRELASADVFVSPSVTAADGNTEGGAPVSLIDAQAAGLAIISTFHADIPEVVIHGQTGLLSAERDVVKLTENIRFFLDHPEKIAVFGAEGRKHVESDYNICLQGKLLGKIYRQIILDCALS
jgi:colanic acid/amylovoran biosynthesis glycosyltransferase